MKRIITISALLLSAGAIFTACGGDSGDDPVTADNLVAVADDVCTENNRGFEELGVRGLTNPGIADEFEGTAKVRRQFVSAFEGIEIDDSVPAEWDEYIALTKKLAASDEAVAAAAEKNDDAAVGKAFEAQTALYEDRDKLAEKLGFEVCGRSPEIEVVESGTGPADDLVFAEPENTVEEAADTYLKAGISGDCEAFNAERHTDAGKLEPAQCEAAAQSLKGGEVIATEQYGPVGVAEIVGAEDVHYATYFATDLDGQLRYAGDVINDGGGLRPATEGDDADANAAAAITALRDGDAMGFNEVLLDPENSSLKAEKDGFSKIGEGDFGKQFITEIRKTGAESELLGKNASYAFYLVEGDEYDWVINLVHAPGAGNHYRMSGYFPIPAED